MLFSIVSNVHAAEHWRFIAPGIEYRDLEGGILSPWSHVHVFRIDLNKNRLKLVTAKSKHMKHASVDQLVEQSHALLGVNGGFFDNNFQPLGLRIQDHRRINPLKRISWWGVFYVQGNKPYISSMQQFSPDYTIDFAVQSGPRLIVNGRIPSLKPGAAERTALGITPDGKVIILVTNSAAMTTRQLAELMKAPPLRCINAINLDGGSSTQLYAHVDSFKLSVHGFSNVGDAVVVTPRKY